MATEVINTRYEILESAPEASSPFVVSKARDREQDRVVTLQTLPRPEASIAQAVQAAATEAMRLEHPHIARVYDQGRIGDTGDLYVASDFAPGITLQERIRRIAPFALTVAADLSVAIAEALEFAHRAGVVHGDLRPADVVLSPEGQVTVTNFAYVRAAQARGGAAAVADDIQALGALLYEMLTGVAPPLLEVAAPAPRAVNPGVPPALDGIVQKALYPDPVVRYRAMGTLLLDLQAARDALRSGRSLAWSPLAERRTPRPLAAETAAASPASAQVGGLVSVEEAPTIPAPRRRRERHETTGEGPVIDEDEGRGARREPASLLSKVLGFVFALAVLGVIAVSWYFSRYIAIPNDVLVPNLVGKTYDDAKALARQQHFTLVVGGEDYSVKWPENQIYQQDPLPGRTIKADKEVSVFRSLGPRLLQVPDLVGMTKDRAVRALQDAGLPEGPVTEDYSDTVQSGVVLSQSLDKGSMVARDSTVGFVVSKGPQPPEPPTDVEADASAPDTVTVHWTQAPRALSYTVYRILDGNSTPVAKALADTQFTDKGLKADTTYSYTVDAVNAAGESGPSDPSLVTTPATAGAAPVLPSDTQVTPGGDASSPDTGDTSPVPPKAPGTARMRQFTLSFRVPRHPRHPRHVQFEVQDVTGTNLVYDETHAAGDEVDAPIQAFGNKVTLRVFLDGKLIKQQTL